LWYDLKVDLQAGPANALICNSKCTHLQHPVAPAAGSDGSWLRLTPRGRDCDVADVSVLGSFLAVINIHYVSQKQAFSFILNHLLPSFLTITFYYNFLISKNTYFGY